MASLSQAAENFKSVHPGALRRLEQKFICKGCGHEFDVDDEAYNKNGTPSGFCRPCTEDINSTFDDYMYERIREFKEEERFYSGDN